MQALLDHASAAQALELLEGLVLPGSDAIDVRSREAVIARLKCPLSAKQYGNEDTLAPLIADACITVCPENPVNFNVDNVRTVKMPGARSPAEAAATMHSYHSLLDAERAGDQRGRVCRREPRG